MATLKFNEKLPTIHQIKELLINEAIKRTNGDQDITARILGISKNTLYDYLKHHSGAIRNLMIALMIVFINISSNVSANSGYATGKVVVNFKAGTTQDEITGLREEYNLEISDNLPQINYYVFKIPSDYTVSEMVFILKGYEIVEKCEPNYFTNTQDVPSDRLFNRQWSLDNPDQVNSDISILEAWDIESGSPDVIVAVIDMGFDMNHEDLQENMWNNPGEIPDNGIDDDYNGYVDDTIGWDFVNQASGLVDDDCDWRNEDNDPTSLKSSHGNRVLGVIGATTDNGIGIAGIAANCQMMLIRAGFYNTEGIQVLSTSAIIKGIIYAVENGARIINISSGSPNYSSSYKSALEYATNNGVLVVCSAGNDASNAPCYPAAYDIPGLLSVGASNVLDAKCSFSNYGSWVDVSAPGQHIMSTLLNDSYGETQGTSFSTPIVAGVAALIFSQHPDWTPAQVQDQIMNTVDTIESLSGINITSGRVNAYRALTSIHEADDASDREQTDTDNEAVNTNPAAGSSSGGGCFIASTDSTTPSFAGQLAAIMIAGLFATLSAVRKR